MTGKAYILVRMILTGRDAPIADLTMLADELGVLVSHLPLGEHDAPDGCSALDPATGAAYVLINSDKPRARRRFTIAHELGHLALGHLQDGEIVIDETLSEWSPRETEANAFAAGLLMPESGVRGVVARIQDRLSQKAGPLEWVVWLAASFGVSEEAAAYRVKNLELDRTIVTFPRFMGAGQWRAGCCCWSYSDIHAGS